MYVFYRHRHDPAHELVLRDGAAFPRHLYRDEWYLHGTYPVVNGRTEADIETLGYCDRQGGVTFGRRLAPPPRLAATRRVAL